MEALIKTIATIGAYALGTTALNMSSGLISGKLAIAGTEKKVAKLPAIEEGNEEAENERQLEIQNIIVNETKKAKIITASVVTAGTVLGAYGVSMLVDSYYTDSNNCNCCSDCEAEPTVVTIECGDGVEITQF